MPQTKWSIAKYVSFRVSQRTRIRRNRFSQPCVRSTNHRLEWALTRWNCKFYRPDFRIFSVSDRLSVVDVAGTTV